MKTRKAKNRCTNCKKDKKKCLPAPESDQAKCLRCADQDRTCEGRIEGSGECTAYDGRSYIQIAMRILMQRKEALRVLGSAINPLPCLLFAKGSAMSQEGSQSLSTGPLQTLLLNVWKQTELVDNALRILSDPYSDENALTSTTINPQNPWSTMPSGWHKPYKLASKIEGHLKSGPWDLESSTATIITRLPANCIAFYMNEKTVAIDIWKIQTVEVDLFGDQLVHTAIQEQDLDTLTAMKSHDPAVFMTKKDGRGLSCLQLATCCESEECFDLVLEFSETSNDQLSFELAIAKKSKSRIEKLFSRGLAIMPYNRYVRIVIELGHADLIDCLLPVFFAQNVQAESISDLATLANNKVETLGRESRSAFENQHITLYMNLEKRRKAMSRLARSLRECHPILADVEMTLARLGDIEMQLDLEDDLELQDGFIELN